LKKEGNRLFSQPIKGPAGRFLEDPEKDLESKQQLKHNKKDLSENVMIVDLVRNDLSKICAKGSVQVDELFGVYEFPQVFQMISTISGLLPESVHWLDAIKATFPMGSMSGAPKKRVMQLIEQYEESRRGLYSGAIGYATPWHGENLNQRDFDFNVVIRSILYNASEKYLSYQVGSAITYNCDAEMEYEECLLKAKAIKKILA
jgi:para-aminobenzoate synthetase component 1